VERGLAFAGHPVEDLSIGLDGRAGRKFAEVEIREGRLGEDTPASSTRFTQAGSTARRGTWEPKSVVISGLNDSEKGH
jgi:hypothetical protein